MFLNCGVGEDSWESLARDQISQCQRKSVLNIHWKHWCWSWSSSTLATWCKNWLIGKDLDSEKVWSQEEKGMIENEMVRWHFWLDGHEFVQALGIGDRQGVLACHSLWGLKELDTTEWLNWSESFVFSRTIQLTDKKYFDEMAGRVVREKDKWGYWAPSLLWNKGRRHGKNQLGPFQSCFSLVF